jgi:hypothetical protein
MGGDSIVSVPFVLSNSSCCCQKVLNNWNIISDPQSISEIKSAPDYVFRGILSCDGLKQKTLNQKNTITGRIRGSVRESAPDGDGRKTNNGSGSGNNTQYSSLDVTCTCSSSGPYFTLHITGGLTGAYRFDGGSVQPYTNVPFSLIVPNIVFLCAGAGTSMEIWSEYAYGDNVTEDPEENSPVGGLISQGSIQLNIFGQSISINLPYNTWGPSWAGEDYSASFTANATINLTRADC